MQQPIFHQREGDPMLFDKFRTMAEFQAELAEREVVPFGAVTEKILSPTEGIVEGHKVILAALQVGQVRGNLPGMER